MGEGDVTDTCHFDLVPADQCVRCKRMQAVKKQNQYLSRGAVLYLYPRALPYMHGTKGCSVIQYMAPMPFVLQYSMLLLLQHCQICPLSCKPMCFCSTQMVQLTRLHNIHNLHKTSLLLIDAYHQTASFCKHGCPQKESKLQACHSL